MSVQGQVESQRAQQVAWQPAVVGATFCAGDSLRVSRWRAAIVLRNDTIIRLDEGTTVTFTKIEEDQPSWLDLLRGVVHFLSRVPQRLTVTTPFVNAAVEGTEFVIRVDERAATLWVFEGRVTAQNDRGTLSLGAGQAAVAEAGQAPKPIVVVRPRDAVQWALYYPPLVDYGAIRVSGPNALSLEGALALSARGDIGAALAQLESIPPEQRDAQVLTLHAGLLLSVGRVERAQGEIDQVLEREPGSGIALALQSVVAVVQNRKQEALQLARRAADQAPDSSVPQIALSYAYQAAFDIEKASESAQRAAELAPDDALVWARVAELWLSRGYHDRALEAAKKATERNPDVARTHTVLGFAQLAEINIEEAKRAFLRAGDLDRADPLPVVGLGLAMIRESDLAEGRQQLEIAASLDPNNAVIRSYLGKAYFEEKRDPLDGRQYAIAKELDPQDPTPYLYDAIRKQLTNRPVEALRDLQESIRLNDNRAPERSSLLLDEDRAARGATIGRIYNNLGFAQRGLAEGWWSLTTDPTSPSAHRLLADTYAALPRFDVARVSELLQSQLLQDLNINNLQPQLAEASLPILELGGPRTLSFSEFNPLFVRDRARFFGNALVGNLKTTGFDAVPSLVLGRLSLSGGVFNFDTDGFRANNDVEDEIYNLFAQAALTPKLNVQLELRQRKTDQGDLRLRFDPKSFSTTFRETIEQETIRGGLRFSPAPHSDVLVSAFLTKREDTVTDTEFLPFRSKVEDKGHQIEGQYLFRSGAVKLVAGGGNYDIDVEDSTRIEGFPVPFPPFCLPPGFPPPTCIVDTRTKSERDGGNAYTYVNVAWPEMVTWTVGVAYDALHQGDLHVEKISPKFGLQISIRDWLRIRLAYLQALKRALVVDQTIEPTQVAGFNQFFDDANGTDATLYGAGLDAVPARDWYAGVAYSLRKRKDPATEATTGRTIRFDSWEDLVRAYLYWTPHAHWAASVEFFYEGFRQAVEQSDLNEGPTHVKTQTLPIALQYFHPSGFFAGTRGTYVRQELDLSPVSTLTPSLTKSANEFLLFDAQVGFRLPGRLGIISVEARNLFDAGFFFQDQNVLQTVKPLAPRFLPTRTVLGRVTLSF